MDFFESQDVARRKTTLLVVYFVLAILVMIVILYAVVITAFSVQTFRGDEIHLDWWRLDILFAVSAVTVAVISLGSLVKILELRGGGQNVATMLGGRRLNPNTQDLEERRLLNVVEEMAVASGVPVPPVFVLEKEDSINAFAAGYTPGDAVIGVNRGTIHCLNRDELQGVIAHEFSHILNGDMRLNVRLIGLLNGILLVATIGYFTMRFGGAGRGHKGGAAAVALIGVAMLIVGYAGLFFARLIKSAVSRQREYLADASAVQFTRNPDGIAGALKKIGGLAAGSSVKSPQAESASHMFFGSALRLSFSAFATHPPLAERIRRIDPQFDGQFPRTAPPRKEPPPTPAKRKAKLPTMTPVMGPVFGKFGDRLPLDPLLVLAAVGAPRTQHVDYARRMMEAMPSVLREAAHDAFSARAVVFALLLDKDDQIRGAQLDVVRKNLGSPTHDETAKLAPVVASQGAEARLPLIEMAQSTLGEMSPGQYDQFRETVDGLVKADRRIDLFEFTLQRGLIARLDRQYHGGRPPRVVYPAMSGLLDEMATLLSTLAHLGHGDEEASRAAYVQAMTSLSGERLPAMKSPNDSSLRVISAALDKLAQSAPVIKKKLLRAALVVVAIDGEVTVGEAEMLRAIADSLDVPLPPLFAGSLEPTGG